MKIGLVGSVCGGQLHFILDSFYLSGPEDDQIIIYDPSGATDLIQSTRKIVSEVNKINRSDLIIYSQDTKDLRELDYLIFLGLEVKMLNSLQQATLSSKLFRSIFENEDINIENLNGIFFGGEHTGLLNAAVLGKKWPELTKKVTVFSGLEYKGRKAFGGFASSKVVALTAEKTIIEIAEDVEDVTIEYEDYLTQEYAFYDAKMWVEIIKCCLDGEENRMPNTYRGVFVVDDEDHLPDEDETEDVAIPIFVYRFENPAIKTKFEKIGQDVQHKIAGVLKESFPSVDDMSD